MRRREPLATAKEVKLKGAAQLNQVMTVVLQQIHEMQNVPTELDGDLSDSPEQLKKDSDMVLKTRLLQLVAILQKGGQFRGFNRKIQIRPLRWRPLSSAERRELEGAARPREASDSEEESVTPMPEKPFELREGVERVGLRAACEAGDGEAGPQGREPAGGQRRGGRRGRL